MRVSRIDSTGRLDASKRTPQGGLKVSAYLTRTGVLTYRQPDGSVVRELRHPDDVFKEDSLATLSSAPVTIGHPGKVVPDNYRAHAVGTVGDHIEAKEDRFVAGTLRVQDIKAVAGVESGNLIELSCGYDCDAIPETGEFNGEKYDARQTNIVYNHVALLPVNGGRAGNDVRIRFDGATLGTLLENEMDPKELESLKAERDAQKARADKAEGERDAQKARADKAEAVLADTARFDAAVERTVKLREDAKSILGSDAAFAGKSERLVMVEALTKADATFRADDKTSDDYLRGRFDTAVAATKAGAESLAATRETVQVSQDTPTANPIDAARARNDERSRNAWKTK